ncbi:choice-of-anchor A family protein [Paenibacillus sp. DMB5]|uniref:choice-of-anchor A family protein n=1 Tax=Paenibacillus sp. DMB5 TaxID=1780103 RepID=UPI00076C9930|nr:choice-of-anchor A family protein [Paenibacillus sp. DMB5]KUP24500.1 hypothetical protein AWJ19_22525 [Paenibacillus sp. DMB5]
MKRKSVLKLSFALAMSAVLLVGGWLASAGQGEVRADSTPLPGVAGKYNVFVLGDLKGYHSDSEGRMAAGGNITLTQGGYSVGHSLSAAEISEMDSLVAGGNLSYEMGEVNGNAVYGGTYTGSGKPRGGTGTLRKETNVINFVSEFALLRAKSQELAALTVNGKTEDNYGNIKLTGTDPVLNVFSVSGSTLTAANELRITAPEGSTAIVNIDGTSVTFKNGNGLTGVSQNKVLYNFPQATALRLESIGVMGTVLAPNAAITFNNGQINGSMIGASLEGSGEFHHKPYTGRDNGTPVTPTATPTPVPTSTATPEPTTAPTSTPTAAPTSTPTPVPTTAATPTPTSGTPATEPPAATPTSDTSTAAPTSGVTPAPTVPATALPTSVVAIPGGTPLTPAGPTVIGTIVTDDELAIDDNPVPLGPGASATAAAAGVTVPQATPVPSPTAGPGPDDEIILDDEIPLGGVTDPGTTAAAAATLPQTGESSPAPYYITGLTLAALGLLLSRTRTGKRKS